MSTEKIPLASVDVIPRGLRCSDVVGKPLKKLYPLLKDFTETRHAKPLQLLFFLEDACGTIYLRSENSCEEGEVDIFHDLEESKSSAFADCTVLSATTFPDAVWDGNLVKMVLRINIGGDSGSGIDLDDHGSKIAQILRNSYGRHERMVQTAIHQQQKNFIAETSLHPQHSDMRFAEKK